MRGGYSGRGRFGAGRHGGGSSSSTDGRGYHGNPCLTMHQPWASLLVHGIKRVEGRSWPSPITGRLWIHAASKVPDPDTIKAMEDFYREIYAVDGITDIKFPDYYPVSRLLGCVEVVGCLRSEELVCWEDVPQSVRLEGLTDFCWLCENPQKLVVPFEMRGYQGVYNLERRIYDGAVRGLTPVQGPLPIKFPLPDPRDRFSLKPGSLAFDASKSEVQKSSSVTAAIAGARAAATQFSNRDPNAATSSETRVREQSWGNHADSNSDHQNLPSVQRSPCLQNQNQPEVQKSSSVTAAIAGARAAATQFSNRDPNAAMSSETRVREQSWANHADSNSDHHNLPSVPGSPAYLQNQNQPSIFQSTSAYSQNPDTEPRRSPRLEYGASNRLVAVALRELKQLSVSERGQPVGRS